MSDNFYQKRAQRRLLIIAIVIVMVGGAAAFIWHSHTFTKITNLGDSVQYAASKALVSNFSAPAPLVKIGSAIKTKITSNQYTLTASGVIKDTNAQRAMNGNLPPLAENATLDKIATLRLQDMFAKQYFAHISPSSSSAITVASSVGYSYIALGENLALGNFEGDQGVVTAWMESPGHRANILDTHYTQIGVAVGEGVYQGAIDWIAVQVFGRPASDCPAPSASLKAAIASGQTSIATDKSELEALQTQISAMQPPSGSAYDQAVASYNNLVDQYNALVAAIKADIAQFNDQVDSYNQCVES
jgi:uncharacterized protein YkwD